MIRKLSSLALVAVLAAPAFAQNAPAAKPTAESGDVDRPCGPRGGKGRGGGGLGRMLERHGAELGIPEATIKAVRDAEEAARPELERLHAQARQARQDLAGGKGDQAAVDAARKAVMDKHAEVKAKVDALLTPAQRTAIEEWKASRGFHRGGRRRPGGRGAPSPS